MSIEKKHDQAEVSKGEKHHAFSITRAGHASAFYFLGLCKNKTLFSDMTVAVSRPFGTGEHERSLFRELNSSSLGAIMVKYTKKIPQVLLSKTF